MATFEKARELIYRNARPLDFARWQYHFENGRKKAVVDALSYYQNEDGGFGHALEADSWNPNSSPIQTCTAIEILKEINFTDNMHPISKGILCYLESGQEFTGDFWGCTVKSNNDYPHAPWWHTNSNSTCHNDYNPTASLAGFIARFAPKDNNLYRLGVRIAKDAFDSFMNGNFLTDMHTVSCFIGLLYYLEQAECDIFDLPAFREKLKLQVKNSITKNTDEWEDSYICKPSQFFNSKDSIFYPDNKALVDYECDFIIRTQLEDGSWNIPWSWNNYPEQWAISKNWWKNNGALANMVFLKGMGKL